jgi:hypothetical protein
MSLNEAEGNLKKSFYQVLYKKSFYQIAYRKIPPSGYLQKSLPDDSGRLFL